MPPLLVCVPSPLLGPAVWGPVERVFRRRGWSTSVPAAPGPVSTGQVLAGLLGALPVDQKLVLVAHSNAGAYVPALVTARPVVAAVFVDAVLPQGTGGPVPLAPAAFLGLLRAKAQADGLLPPWTAWWDDGDVEGPVTRRRDSRAGRTRAAAAAVVVLRRVAERAVGLGQGAYGLPRLRGHLCRRTGVVSGPRAGEGVWPGVAGPGGALPNGQVIRDPYVLWRLG